MRAAECQVLPGNLQLFCQKLYHRCLPISRLKVPVFTHGDERRAPDKREIISTFVRCEKNAWVVLLPTSNPIVFAGTAGRAPLGKSTSAKTVGTCQPRHELL